MVNAILISLLIIVGAIVLLLFFSALVYSRQLVRSHRQPIIRTPKDYRLKYEEVEFKSTDGIKIKGWFIPGATKKAVLISHPFTFNRHGFEPKNQGWLKLYNTPVDMLTTAKEVNKAGYSSLMFDFRNHGESGRGITGIGVNESQDALGALAYLKSRPEVDPDHIGLVGFCMGANAFITMLDKTTMPKCLIAIQPTSLAVTANGYLKKFAGSFLTSIFIWLTGKMAKLQGGYELPQMSPCRFAHQIKIPTLYIQAASDPWGTVADVKSFYDLTKAKKEFWVIKGKMKRFDTYNYVGEHPEKIIKFLNHYV
ncbi:alpha/beta hydrolase [Patescibacteria group bacterium]